MEKFRLTCKFLASAQLLDDSQSRSHTSGTAIGTGLTFTESWSETAALSNTFGRWLQLAYSMFSTSFLIPATLIL